jgi:hypothetical protein
MRQSITLTALGAALTLLAGAARAAQAQDQRLTRLGGYNAIAAVTDDFIGKLATDPMFSKFFIGTAPTPRADPAARRRPALHGHGGTLRLHRARHEAAHAGLGSPARTGTHAVELLVTASTSSRYRPREKNEVLADGVVH